jgi:hypothetical protein
MRKLIVLGASALVLALGAAQASATSYHGSQSGLTPSVVDQAYAAPTGAEGQFAPNWITTRRH